MNDFQKDNAERMAVYQQNVTEIADFILRFERGHSRNGFHLPG